ncbi:MAG: TetR/AcrR family transcriptional regulator [Planctomycetota bacterium]
MTPASREPDTRTRLLEAGAELFTKKGFHACGLNEVLQHAGVPKGSFYHHFGSKEEFGVALVERATAEHLEELEGLVSDPATPPVDRLRRVFETIRAECAELGPTSTCLIPKLALETAHLSAPVLEAVQRAYREWTSQLAVAVREGQALGVIRSDQTPERLASLLVMLWEGATMRMQVEHSMAPLDDFLDLAFDSLLRPKT